MKRLCTWFTLLAVTIMFVGCGPKSETGTEVKLKGAGASFPAPLYQKWFKSYNSVDPNVKVDYLSVGSGSGVKSVIDETVDFGASDAAMNEEEIAKVAKGVQLIPMTAGSIVIAYNLDGVDKLKLSREAYIDIFLGKIKKWNDPKIAASNPGVTLPDMPISVVVRSDSSGTTFVFTKHLSAISQEFADTVGVNKQPEWPAGSNTGAKGNEGITATIKQNSGSIGYIEYGYAMNADINMASLENKSGEYIAPSIESAQAALASAVMPENMIVWVSDPEGPKDYPIVTFTWIICYKQYDDEAKLKALKDVLNYSLTTGQESSVEMGYIPLPESVVEKCKAALDNIKAGSAAE